MNKNEGNDDSSDDELKVEDLIKKTFIDANSVDITKGDKIRVIKGELIDLCGTVVTIEDG
jgi:transcription antitermination factor NusG